MGLQHLNTISFIADNCTPTYPNLQTFSRVMWPMVQQWLAPQKNSGVIILPTQTMNYSSKKQQKNPNYVPENWHQIWSHELISIWFPHLGFSLSPKCWHIFDTELVELDDPNKLTAKKFLPHPDAHLGRGGGGASSDFRQTLIPPALRPQVPMEKWRF